jgi:hypothetical protein
LAEREYSISACADAYDAVYRRVVDATLDDRR